MLEGEKRIRLDSWAGAGTANECPVALLFSRAIVGGFGVGLADN